MACGSICLGGVCIPYTVVVSFLALMVKWVMDHIGYPRKPVECPNKQRRSKTSKFNNNNNNNGSDSDQVVTVIHSYPQFLSFIKNNNNRRRVVVKFTANWCKPCQTIHPLFCSLAANYQHDRIRFATVDIDQVKDVADMVTILPTMIIFQNGIELDRLSSSDERKIQKFIQQYTNE